MHIQIEKRSASLAQKLFRADQVRNHEEQAATASLCNMYGLMQRAGKAVFLNSVKLVPDAENYLVIVGKGNNAGDGYIAALHALQADKDVTVCAVEPERALHGDALAARDAFLAAGGFVQPFNPTMLSNMDIVIDALLGTGLQGTLRPEYINIIDVVNRCDVPVLSVDVPSGLNADTGQSLASYIQADMTVTFVGIKQGLVTAAGKQASGTLVFEDLDIGPAFTSLCKSNTHLLNLNQYKKLAPRQIDSHKGRFGRLLCVGGNKGMAGAIRLASEAALGAGTGLVKVYAHQESFRQIGAGRPELMVTIDDLQESLEWASCIVLGPGLGTNDWAVETFKHVIQYCQKSPKPIVIDADALNLLPQHASSFATDACIITPHAGEAARLLGTTVEDVDANRYNSARLIAKRYQTTCILKGAGTIIDSGTRTWVCEHGNPGMATAGMGDVLSGILGAMLAQNMQHIDAAKYGVCVHAKAADIIAAEYGERGMLASDIFDQVRRLINT